MEKVNDMQQKKVNDDELDQVTGGRNIFKVFTTEFFKPKNQDISRQTQDDNFGISTLEMRSNPMKKQETEKSVKL